MTLNIKFLSVIIIDENYKKDFEKDFGVLFINESVQDEEYDSELSDEYVKD